MKSTLPHCEFNGVAEIMVSIMYNYLFKKKQSNEVELPFQGTLFWILKWMFSGSWKHVLVLFSLEDIMVASKLLRFSNTFKDLCKQGGNFIEGKPLKYT